MNLAIDPVSPEPLYRQLYAQISAAVLSGTLQGGETLPPIRSVAAELRISVISVKRAWEELDRDGFIHSAVGRGSFVAQLSDEERRAKRRVVCEALLRPALERCRALGAGAAELEALLQDLLEG